VPAPHVLIGFDGSDAAVRAIETVARLIPGARVTVVVVRESWLPLERSAAARLALPDTVIAPATEALDQELEHTARELVEGAVARAAAVGLDAEPVVEVAGAPWRGLDAAARRHGALAIACGASGRGGLARSVLGTTADALVHHVASPVLVVPDGDVPADGPLLVGYDRSEAARAAIEAAAALFPDRHALVAHAWSSPIRRSYAGERLLASPVDDVQQLARSLDDVYAADAEEAAEEGAAFAREHRLDASPLVVASRRGGWRALDDAAAEAGAAAIVVGSRGRGTLAATVLGSVSSGLVHNARRPVLVAREAAAQPPA
jgi:nucleotide-binding universal stress UspA family protein